ncbi:double-strand break repair helicase AddA [Novosphingobium sp. FSY-8]|uniref:DNA 3'-5' helicase n=1 Tax=Novosphingobium ovatum TaxID=1908523 RepID=A0ABW9XA30_9SPHN|nr:double-strand break repair helicase AddA [Novosphingobium ovatum]NBC35381.1 double-strand break repair helicase AddA [Novosphingobium ovatum]
MSAPKSVSGDAPTVHPLAGNQALAVHPRQTVWLSASAGTGKTQVLSARVLRLLLEPQVSPEQILCLTFTKAGATEMAARINETLARWVRADPARLAMELHAIGADIAPQVQDRARTLFAAVLDCPGGGLRIDTIHAFAQWLLAAFPEEAGLTAGARPMEEQEKALLSRQVLGDLLLDAETAGDRAITDAVADLSLRMGPDAVEAYLMRCAGAGALWQGRGDWAQGDLVVPVRRLLGLRSDASMDDLPGLCTDFRFDVRSLRATMVANQQWKAKTGEANANAIGDFLAADPAARVGLLDDLWAVFYTQKDEPRAAASLVKIDPHYGDHVARVGESIQAVRLHRARLQLAAWLTPALRLGRAFARAWEAAKAREGLIDFDDQIARAADLLAQSDMADWIRYKLDRRFDHILVDEAQDTNAAQWRIIEALTEEFFAGEGAHGQAARTLFVVGDYKQAIFGFQGTSPENFEAARLRVRERMNIAADNAEALRDASEAAHLVELGLEQSFRTASDVLNFVDAAIGHVGAAAYGLREMPEPHKGQDRPGHVVLWRAVGGKTEDEDTTEDSDSAAESWLSRPERDMADRIARQVRAWMDSGFPLVKGRKKGEPPRRATPGDVMILVRKRRELAGLIVARLHAAGVPVAGVDRLRLGAPLAVRDVVAGLRFAAQPGDDLHLAALLVSPIFGWSQDDLLRHAWRGTQIRLWDHLQSSADPLVVRTCAQLAELLARADFEPVPALIQWMLAGPWAARRALVGRLGAEANDPLDELVNAALAHAATATSSLAGFLAWFDAGDGELKREAGGAGDMVRVMTVHGSKGLQAPIVILADAAGNPDNSLGRPLAVPDPVAALTGDERRVPLPPLRKDEKIGAIAEADAASARAESEEHWRLLYVAMTRAEEALFIGGALGLREKEPAKNSWYRQLAELFGLDQWVEDPIWGGRAELAPIPALPAGGAQTLALPMLEALPGWVQRMAPDEPRPPRPLAPSSLGEDASSAPPQWTGAGDAQARAHAARRGTLIHGLLERLPPVAPDKRRAAADKWLARMAADWDDAARAEMTTAALMVIEDPRWADLFGPDALAEAPIAALVGDQVVSGTIDRLRVTAEAIHLIDFKTTRRPPRDASGVQVAIWRQMAAYVAALQVAYPGRRVQAGVLYTHGPHLIELPQDALAAHKPGFAAPQQSLAL